MDAAAEACIICLCDLPLADATSSDPDASKQVDDEDDLPLLRRRRQKSPKANTDLVANLRPCNHYLHDDCIKQWIEKANSCPVCRTVFNVVELSTGLGGPVVDSYAVQNKVQVADLDPSFLVGEDELSEPCIVCGTDNGNEDAETLLCDNCNRCCHVFCAGLDVVPIGDWFCHECLNDTTSHNISEHGSSVLRRIRETEGLSLAQRSRITRERRENGNWARVWRAIYEQTNLDIDFPFDDEHNHHTPRQRRRAADAEQAFEEAWQRRAHIAEQQGAGEDFPTFETTRRLIVPPRGESQEELRAWNAFDKARSTPTNQEAARGRKRKSTTSSPRSPADPEHTRVFKRPRVQHPPSSAARAGSASSSRNTRESSAATTNVTRRRPRSLHAPEGSNFLTSLLSEVESDSAANAANHEHNYYSDALTHGSPQASSPGSPFLSAHATPSTMSPQPMSPSSRLSSPAPISLNGVSHSPTFSPYSPLARDARSASPNDRPLSRGSAHQSSRPARHHTSLRLSYEHKSEIQAWVSQALKPHYRKSEMTKEEYTMINRDVSRLLYDRVGNEGGLVDDEAKVRWKKEAQAEVDRVVAIYAEGKKSKGKMPAHDVGIGRAGRAARPSPLAATGSS